MDKLENILYIQIFLLFLLSSQPADCKKNKTLLSRETNDQKLNINETGESRVDGGFINHNVPDFLGTTWAHDNDGRDAKLLGHAIGMGGSHILMAGDTYLSAEKIKAPKNNALYLGESNPHNLAKFMIPSPEKFDSEVNPNPPRARDNYDFEIMRANLNSSPFGLFKVKMDDEKGGGGRLPTFAAPNLEHDVNEFGKDCRAYGWSRGPKTGSRAGHDMQFVDFEVDPGRCVGALCSVHTFGRANFCGGRGDNGMPVLCGQEKKLTYLLHGSSKGDTACDTEMKAYHVPHLVRDLKDAMRTR